MDDVIPAMDDPVRPRNNRPISARHVPHGGLQWGRVGVGAVGRGSYVEKGLNVEEIFVL